jgi:hypothetical protein
MSTPPLCHRRVSLPPGWQIDRRDFLKASAASMFGLLAGACTASSFSHRRAPLRFGLVTDSHYADAPPNGTRFYRESLAKVREAVDRLRAENVAFLAFLGDLKDMAKDEPEARTLSHLVAIEQEVRRFGGPTYHVLGNHDMDNLSKSQVMARIENTGVAGGRSYYAFSRGGLRFIVLDATYDKDGRDYDHGKFDWKDTNVPAGQVAWLARELDLAASPVIVMVHQRLDGDGPTSIRNRAAIRDELERSGKVLAVFQGHDHPGFYNSINGIHYYTLRAVIEGSGAENNAYAVVDVAPNLDISITGYRRARTMELAHRSVAGKAG